MEQLPVTATTLPFLDIPILQNLRRRLPQLILLHRADPARNSCEAQNSCLCPESSISRQQLNLPLEWVPYRGLLVRQAKLARLVLQPALEAKPMGEIPRLCRGGSNKTLSIRRQCALTGVARSGVYRPEKPANDNDLALMRRLDELLTAWPFLGSRRMTAMLRAEGEKVNRKRVQRLMRKMGIVALGPKPNTTKPTPGHRIFPYLLRNLKIEASVGSHLAVRIRNEIFQCISDKLVI
jgi:putative transposase